MTDWNDVRRYFDRSPLRARLGGSRGRRARDLHGGRVVRRLTGHAAHALVDRIAVKYTGAPYDIRSGMTAFLIRPERFRARDYTAA